MHCRLEPRCGCSLRTRTVRRDEGPRRLPRLLGPPLLRPHHPTLPPPRTSGASRFLFVVAVSDTSRPCPATASFWTPPSSRLWLLPEADSSSRGSSVSNLTALGGKATSSSASTGNATSTKKTQATPTLARQTCKHLSLAKPLPCSRYCPLLPCLHRVFSFPFFFPSCSNL